MEQKTILLNGGRVVDVTPLEDADEFLVGLLGAAPSMPAVPTLRVIDNADGQHRVGVFVGGRHVGFLSQAADTDLVATLQACDLHGAAARARGNLVPSWNRPGKVEVKVNLAESSRLLGDPAAEPSAPTTPEQPATSTAASLLVSSLEDDVPSSPEASLQDAGPPELFAGHSQEYPDWPPTKSQPSQTAESAQPAEPVLAAESAQLPEPMQMEPVFRTSATFGRSPLSESMTPPAPVSPSDSGWMPAPAQAAQTGWLAAPGEASQARWHNAQPPSGQAATAVGAGNMTAEQSASWQDHAERSGGAQGGFAAGWSSGSPATQPTHPAQPAPHAKPARTSGAAKTWIISALAFLVLATFGFVVWKTVFAAQTYTDPKFGYSFSYPGLWKLEEDAGQFASFSGAAGDSSLLGGAVAGHGDVKSQDDFGVLGVVVFDATALGLADSSQWAAQFQLSLTQATSAGSGVAVVEPVSATTVGGIAGHKATITVTSGTLSLTTSLLFLIDGTVGYMAIATAPESNWADNQKAFDAFFDSFRPGGARI